MMPDLDQIAALIAAEAPQFADLPLRPVPQPGSNNHMVRLGEDLALRLPVAERYAAQLEKEARWLPVWAATLPVALPEVVYRGTAGPAMPFPWLIQTWVPGDVPDPEAIATDVRFAADVAGLLRALHGMDTTGAPPPGGHSFGRGGPLAVYDAETRAALADLDLQAGVLIWDAALRTGATGTPVWVHGDLSPGNLICRHGRLTGLIDIGNCAVGDAACDLVMAWTVFEGDARAAFLEHVGAGRDIWARARGWALWKAAIVAAGHADPPGDPVSARQVLHVLLQEEG